MIATTLQPATQDDRTLLERASAGDHTAFSVLFERYKSGVYRFCVLMLGDRASAEDIYQEVFLNFYKACRNGDQVRNVRNYLITAARNRCLNSIRLTRRHTTLDDSPVLSYDHDVTISDTGEHLQNALMQIHPQYREAFLLFELEGYSYEEICEQLQIGKTVVRNRIYRAKQALQKILRPLLRDDDDEQAVN